MKLTIKIALICILMFSSIATSENGKKVNFDELKMLFERAQVTCAIEGNPFPVDTLNVIKDSFIYSSNSPSALKKWQHHCKRLDYYFNNIDTARKKLFACDDVISLIMQQMKQAEIYPNNRKELSAQAKKLNEVLNDSIMNLETDAQALSRFSLTKLQKFIPEEVYMNEVAKSNSFKQVSMLHEFAINLQKKFVENMEPNL